MKGIVCKRVISELELKQAFAVRKSVFVDEQNISEDDEWDGLDDAATQFIAINGKIVIGTGRVRFLDSHNAKIERMAVLKPFRRKGVGREIINVIEKSLKQNNISTTILHAQWEAIPFYIACGFKPIGVPFLEAGIKHIKMEKELGQNF